MDLIQKVTMLYGKDTSETYKYLLELESLFGKKDSLYI